LFIPKAKWNEGFQGAINYIMDLMKVPYLEVRWHCPVLILGGMDELKTRFLDIMFPIQAMGTQSYLGSFFPPSHYTLHGNQLKKFLPLTQSVVQEIIEIKKGEWKLQNSSEEGITLIELKGRRKIEMVCQANSKQFWLRRLLRLTTDSSSGIDMDLLSSETETVEIKFSLWNFTTLSDSLNAYHFFPQKGLFLVLWNLADGESGLRWVMFWISYLKTRLEQKEVANLEDLLSSTETLEQPPRENQSTHSVCVVSVGREETNLEFIERAEKMVNKEGFTLLSNFGFHYWPVRFEEPTSIDDLKHIFNDRIQTHASRPDSIRVITVMIHNVIKQCREKRSSLPIMGFQEFITECRKIIPFDEETLVAELKWNCLGKCLLVDGSLPVLVLDYSFVSKNRLVSILKIPAIQNGTFTRDTIRTMLDEHKNRDDYSTNFALLLSARVGIIWA